MKLVLLETLKHFTGLMGISTKRNGSELGQHRYIAPTRNQFRNQFQDNLIMSEGEALSTVYSLFRSYLSLQEV